MTLFWHKVQFISSAPFSHFAAFHLGSAEDSVTYCASRCTTAGMSSCATMWPGWQLISLTATLCFPELLCPCLFLASKSPRGCSGNKGKPSAPEHSTDYVWQTLQPSATHAVGDFHSVSIMLDLVFNFEADNKLETNCWSFPDVSPEFIKNVLGWFGLRKATNKPVN